MCYSEGGGSRGEEESLKRIYTYACHEDEEALCALERRSLFADAVPAGTGAFVASRELEPGRSPFLKSRLDVRLLAASPTELAELARGAGVAAPSFKVVFAKTDETIPYADRREAERIVGGAVRGTADMRTPAERFGVARLPDGRWAFGPLTENDGAWRRHAEKPRQYSTALGARLARAVVNVAAPKLQGTKAIDPCCGIGIVLLEALSMGLDIVGSDVNPLAVLGARENLTFYGYPNVVRIADARDLTGAYDAAIVDLPYNLCSALQAHERDELLAAVRRIAARAVVVATEDVSESLRRAGFDAYDGCEVRKGAFRRLVAAVR